jgi:hypothetical protein
MRDKPSAFATGQYLKLLTPYSYAPITQHFRRQTFYGHILYAGAARPLIIASFEKFPSIGSDTVISGGIVFQGNKNRLGTKTVVWAISLKRGCQGT